MNPGGLLILVAMFALLWVLFIMPQRKRIQAQRELVQGIEVGDEIVTVGGLIGRVTSLTGDDELRLEVAPGTELRVARRAVGAVLTSAREARTHDERIAPESERDEVVPS